MDNFVTHSFDPVYNADSKILILGTMPSPKSRENGFYYSHPQNKFWRVLSVVLKDNLPNTPNEKKEFLLRNKIAVWDVLHSCKISGADDSSIKEESPNDLSEILESADIRAVFTTGIKAQALYKKYMKSLYNVKTFNLPSTSPANCRLTLDDLCGSYTVILDWI